MMLVGIALMGFGASAAWIAPQVPTREIEPATTKLEEVLGARPPYDVLFFGSSHTLRGVKPAVFERRSKRLGHEVRAFNFGVAGSRWHETDRDLRRSFEALGEGLPACVFVEISNFDPRIDEENARKSRVVAWHDRDAIPSIFASVLEDPYASALGKISRAAEHAVHFGMRELRAGDGPLLFEDRERPDKLPLRLRYIPREQGYANFSKERNARAERRNRQFLARLDEFEAARSELIEDRATAVAAPRWFRGAVLRQAGRIEARGVTAVYYAPPAPRKIVDLRFLEEAGIRVFRFDDPERFPELYDSENRHDHAHLNDAGAKILSRELADAHASIFGSAP